MKFVRSRLGIALGLSVVLSLLGVLLILVDCGLVGPEFALNRARHDPAKVLFHVLILPSAAFVFLFCFPLSRIGAVLSDSYWRRGAIVVASVLVIASAYYCVYDARRGFEQRIAPPQSFSDIMVRTNLIIVDNWLRDKLEERSKPDESISPISLTSLFDQIGIKYDDSDGEKLTLTSNASQYYFRITQLLVSGSDREPMDWTGVGRSPQFLEDASVRAWLAGVLIFPGLLLPAAWFWTLILYRGGPGWKQYKAVSTDQFVGGAMMVLTLLAFWTFLKIYSEWYGKHYDDQWQSLGEVTLAIAVTAGALSLGYLLRHDLGTKGLTVPTVFAGCAFIFGIVAKIKPEIVAVVAQRYMALAPHEHLMAYILVSLLLCGVLLAWYRDVQPLQSQRKGVEVARQAKRKKAKPSK